MLLQFYAPASVVIDLKGNVLYVYGETGKFLRPAPGQPSFNIIDMAREGLQMELRSAILTINQGTPTLSRELSIKTNSGFHPTLLCIRSLSNPNEHQNLLLVSFEELSPPASDKPLSAKRKRSPNFKSNELRYIEELKLELAYTKENLQATIEEQYASNEELKCTNEEMQSTNEELQSTNEELETSKEELQSTNEELITINAELQSKILQLSNIQNDMKNLLDNIHLGTIFLDQQLVIRRFTREATQIYNLIASDLDRPLSDIKAKLLGEEDRLLSAAQSVLDNLAPIELKVSTIDNHWFLVRIQPYRTMENIIDGVVLTFTDITDHTKMLEILEARLLAENIVNTLREPLVVLDNELKVVVASRSFYQYFLTSVEETEGRPIYQLSNGHWNTPELRSLLSKVLSHNQPIDNYPVEHDFPHIGHRKLLLNAHNIIGQTDMSRLILLAMEDVTDKD
jgi:hypothetical protein